MASAAHRFNASLTPVWRRLIFLSLRRQLSSNARHIAMHHRDCAHQISPWRAVFLRNERRVVLTRRVAVEIKRSSGSFLQI